jgi:hypothetical protein
MIGVLDQALVISAREANHEWDDHHQSPWIWPSPRDSRRHISVESMRTNKDALGTTPHDLRVTYSTAARNAGVDPDIISILDNHTSRGGNPMTEKYIKASGLGPLLIKAQNDTSAFLWKALGLPALPPPPTASEMAEYAKDAV